MPYPAKFYYRDLSAGRQYTRKRRGGKLSVRRMLKKQPCWLDPSPVIIQKPKALIIADWTATAWDPNKIDNLERVLYEALELGFPLFVWQRGEIIPFTREMIPKIFEQSFRDAITPEDPTVIAKEFLKKHKQFIRDQIQVVDDHDLNWIMGEIEPDRRRISDKAFTQHSGYTSLIKRLLKKMVPPVQDIRHEVLNDSRPFPAKEYPELPIAPYYLSLTLTSNNVRNLFEKESINIGTTILQLQQLEQLSEIDFSCAHIPFSYLAQLFDNNRFINKLQLGPLLNVEDNFRDLLNLAYLETLTVENCELSTENFFIIAQQPKLKNLTIIGKQPRLDVWKSPFPFINSLENITLESCDISENALSTLLQSNDGLKKLVIKACDLKQPMKLIKKLKSLEEIDLSECPDISPHNILQLLAMAPAIKILRLPEGVKDLLLPDNLRKIEELAASKSIAARVIHNLKAFPALRKLSLSDSKDLADMIPYDSPQLTALTIKRTNISLHNLGILSYPELKTLTLSQCNHLIDDGRMPALDHLERLEINACKIPHHNIEKLLRNTSALQEIMLDNMEGIDDFIQSRRFYRERLLRFHLSQSQASLAEILHFILAPQLRTLTLSQCPNIAIEEITQIQFPYLEILNLHKSHISIYTLQSFLTQCPRLTQIDASYSSGLRNPFTQDLFLPQLEELNLEGSDISTENLLKLIASAPNLKTLRIARCKNIILNSFVKQKLANIFDVNMSTEIAVEPDAPPPLERHLYYVPPPPHIPRELSASVPDKSQDMIINKLSKYLSLTQNHLHLIPKLLDGICSTLCAYAREHDIEPLLDAAFKWNERPENIQEVAAFFDTLMVYFLRYQSSETKDLYYCIGDPVAYLRNHKKSCILADPYHAISLNPIPGEDAWYVYDPNFKNGKERFSTDELNDFLKGPLTSAVFIKQFPDDPLPAFDFTVNAGEFIYGGGLIRLLQSQNAEKLLEQLITTTTPPSVEQLEGLRMRDTGGTPAWLYCLHGNLRCIEYAFTLLQTYITAYQDAEPNGLIRLQQSLAVLSPLDRYLYLEKLITLNQTLDPIYYPLLNTLSHVIRDAPHHKHHYEQLLTAWQSRFPFTGSVPEYCQLLTQPGGDAKKQKKSLVKCTSSEGVTKLRFELQKHCKTSGRPYFYVDSPDDLRCSGDVIVKEDGRYVSRKGPGGPLHDFLTKYPHTRDNPPVIIVNYEKFDANDIVSLNGLLDDLAHADGTPLPEYANIIGPINTNKPGCYQGSDFYSRFDKPTPPAPPKNMFTQLPPLPEEAVPDGSEAFFTIDLHYSEDYKDLLLGEWVFKGTELAYKPGLLVKALQSGLPIEIKHGLWDQKEFVDFYRNLCSKEGVEYPGPEFADGRIRIPKDYPMIRNDVYDWSQLSNQIRFQKGLEPNAPTLNLTCLEKFLNQYHCNDETKKLEILDGILEANKDKGLIVNLTHPLSEEAWGILFAACEEYNVKLTVAYANGVFFPMDDEFPPSEEPEYSFIPWDFVAPREQSTTVFVSSDIDTTVAMLNRQKDWIVLDVSDWDVNDFFPEFDGDFEKGFHSMSSFVLDTLEAGKKIILKGQFSQSLREGSAGHLLERLQQKHPGALALVTDDETCFTHLPLMIMTHEVTKKHQQQVLIEEARMSGRYTPEQVLDILPDVESDQLADTNLAILETHLKFTPTPSSPSPWEGMESLSSKVDLPPFRPETSAIDAKKFHEDRYNAVETLRKKKEPYAFLAGITGVGKTTFVKDYYKAKDGTLYQGEENILAFLRDDKEGEIGLLLDECNLKNMDWSMLEGLYGHPPSIFYQGEYHVIPPNKFIFLAGNPLEYGAGRNFPSFLQRHGNAIVFQPLPPAVLYEDILKPIFSGTSIESEQVRIAAILLDTYYLVTHFTKDKVLISPRTLEMMALLIVAYHQEYPHQPIEDVTRHFAYQLSLAALPEEHQPAFKKHFGVVPNIEQENAPIPIPTTPMSHALLDLLRLRHFRLNSATNIKQLEGGLCGMIIQGDPGAGKSYALKTILADQGYTEIRKEQLETFNIDEHPDFFVYVPASMQYDDKKALIELAFDKGGIAIIEEINSSPMLEGLVNALSNGETPEGNKASRPGFMMFGTENPPTMEGRLPTSQAFADRFLKLELNYTPQQIKWILVNKGLEEQQAEQLLSAFHTMRENAIRHQEEPPNLRDLIKSAEGIARANQAFGLIIIIANQLQIIRNTIQQFIPPTIPGMMFPTASLPETIMAKNYLRSLTNTAPNATHFPLLYHIVLCAFFSSNDGEALQNDVARKLGFSHREHAQESLQKQLEALVKDTHHPAELKKQVSEIATKSSSMTEFGVSIEALERLLQEEARPTQGLAH